MPPDLPSFEHPPVVEVVMGVQFQRLDALLAPHLGKFWTMIDTEYPECRENPPIIPQIEDFSQPGAIQRGQFELSNSPDLPRVFFEDGSGRWLIQVQRDRFLHNWRSGTDQVEYPRYPEVSRRFFKQWETFQAFANDIGLESIQIVQLEITYLNQVPIASAQLGEVFPDFSWRDGNRILPRPESCTVFCSFMGKDGLKRLRVSVQPVLHEGQQQLRFELTVRGTRREDESLEKWFADGRAWIVTAFADLTSPEWHDKWGRTV